MSTEVVDRRRLEFLQKLTGSKKSHLLNELIYLFIEQSPQLLEKMETALESQDFEKLEKLAHKFRGSGTNLGGVKLGDSCQALEGEAKDGETVRLRHLLLDVKRDYQRLRIVLVKEWGSSSD